MQNFLDKLAAMTMPAKLGVLFLIVALLGAGYWYFLYGDMMEEMEQLKAQGEKLEKEKNEYERRKREYLAFREEVNKLLEEQKELIRILPKSDDIEQFIEGIQAQVELAGLSKVTSVRDAAVPQDMYVKIPIRMSAVGTYHQINHFFKNVGDMRRIVNIEDLRLTPVAEAGGQLAPSTQLAASFVATTFQFHKPGSGAVGGPQGGGTSITSGGH